MPVIPTASQSLAIGNRPTWCRLTSAGMFRVGRDGGRFDRHYHDCDEYWLIFAGKARILSEGREFFVQAGDIVCTERGQEHDVLEVYEDLQAFYLEDATVPGGRTGHLHRDAVAAVGHAVLAAALPADFPC